MATKNDPPPPTPPVDPDEEFFKTHGVEDEEDQKFLKSAALREEFLEHRRKAKADAEKKNAPKKRLFGKRD